MAGRRIIAGAIVGGLAASLLHPVLGPALRLGLPGTSLSAPAPQGPPQSASEASQVIILALTGSRPLSLDEVRTVGELAMAGAQANPDNGFWWAAQAWSLDRLREPEAAQRARSEAMALGGWTAPWQQEFVTLSIPEASYRTSLTAQAFTALGRPTPAPDSYWAGPLAVLPGAFLAACAASAALGLAAWASSQRSKWSAAWNHPSLGWVMLAAAAGAAVRGHAAAALALAGAGLAVSMQLLPPAKRGAPWKLAAALFGVFSAAGLGAGFAGVSQAAKWTLMGGPWSSPEASWAAAAASLAAAMAGARLSRRPEKGAAAFCAEAWMISAAICALASVAALAASLWFWPLDEILQVAGNST
jgi:hypothetical protein